MSTPKTTFYLSNGTKLTDVYPLESNGPASLGAISGPNQSIPNEIVDIDYASNSITVYGDLTERFMPLISTTVGGLASSNKLVVGTQNDFNNLMTNGLAVGMFVEIIKTNLESQAPVPNRTRVTAIDAATRTITISDNLRAAVNNRSVKFCYPFNIVDLDPSTPSPYVGDYAASSSMFNNGATVITLSAMTPLVTASFDVANVFTGTNGSWIIQGLTNAVEVFYPNSTFTVTNNTFPAANTTYTVANTFQSQSYDITDIVITSTNSVLTVRGNVGQFFVAVDPARPQQLVVAGNTTHSVGAHPLNGAHDIIATAYNSTTDTTTVTIGTVITGVSSQCNGLVRPALPTAAIVVTGLVINGTQPNGVVSAGSPVQLPFAAAPAITPTSPHNYIISWRVAGDKRAIFTIGHVVTIKNNNYYPYKRLIVDSVVYNGSYTEIRTQITDPSNVTPTIGMSGSIVYPAPAVPYGHIQYTVLKPATSLQLVGRGATHYNSMTTWGQALQNSAIYHLENFAKSTPPVSPLTGQYWFDTSVPAMNVMHDGAWHNVVVAGMPVQSDVDMNNNAIVNLADIAPSDPNLTQALNVRSGDLRYVNVTGDTMTGVLNMGDNKITGVKDTDIPTGAVINTNLTNGTDVLNMRTADARYVNVDGDTMLGSLNMGAFRITNVADPAASQDAATKSYVDSLSSGIVWLQPVRDPNLFDDSLSSPPVLADASMLFYRSYYVKPVEYAILGVNDANKIWHIGGDRTAIILPGHKIIIKDNTKVEANQTYTVQSVTLVSGNTHVKVVEAIPTLTTISGNMYHAGGSWNSLYGRVVAWDGNQWVDILEREVQVGDRFGVYFEVDNDETGVPVPGGSFGINSVLGTPAKPASGKIVTVNSVASNYAIDWGTTAGSVYPPQTPSEPDAVSVLGVNSPHYGHSYTFRGTWASGAYNSDYKWIEFAGPSMLIDGAGLKYTGNILNVGQGTGITVSTNAVAINTTYMNTNYMRRDGSVDFRNHISMGGYRLITMADPVNAQDAVTLKYLQDNYVGSGGESVMTANLNMGGFKVTNVATPTAGTDAANKTYVDTKVAKAGDTMTGKLTMSSATGAAVIDMGTTNKIINLADPVNNMDAVNLQTADARYVNAAGDTMTGPLTMSADPTQNMHAATKQYVDSTVNTMKTTIQAATIDGGGF